MMDFEGAIAEIKNKDNAETFNKSVHSLQAIVDNLLAHGRYGLSALKALIDTIDDELDRFIRNARPPRTDDKECRGQQHHISATENVMANLVVGLFAVWSGLTIARLAFGGA